MTIDQFLEMMATKAPELLGDLAAFAKEFYQVTTQAPNVGTGQEDVTRIDFTNHKAGDRYEVKPINLSDDQIESLQTGLAHGLIKEAAAKEVKAFITGLMVRGGL